MDAKRLDFFERLLHFKPVFDRLCQVAESKLLQAAESGYELQHHKVTKGRGSRDWNTDADTLAAVLGDKVFGKPELLTPAAAEKVFDRAELQQFITKREGGLKIAPVASILREVSINASEFN